jgi:DNA-binding NarL/FixJ family response regulator
MVGKIKIGIADDQALFRKAIATVLSAESDFEVIIEAEDGKKLIDKLENEENPDVLILDLRMPEINGIEATEWIRKHKTDLKIIIVSLHDEVEIIEHLFEKGANAYLDKNSEPEEVIKAIKTVYSQDYYFTAAVRNALEMSTVQSEKRINFIEEHKISKREKEVLDLICQEYTNSEIAQKMDISPRTVDGHRLRLLQKSMSRNTAGLVLFAIKNGLIEMGKVKV